MSTALLLENSLTRTIGFGFAISPIMMNQIKVEKPQTRSEAWPLKLGTAIREPPAGEHVRKAAYTSTYDMLLSEC